MANQGSNAARSGLGQLPQVEVAPQSYQWNLRVRPAEPTPDDEVPTPPVAAPAVLHVVLPGESGARSVNEAATRSPHWPGRLPPVEVAPQTYEWNLRVKASAPEVHPWPTLPIDQADATGPAQSRPGRRRWFKRR